MAPHGDDVLEIGFAEIADRLEAARHALTSGTLDRRLLDELMGCIHSVKGIASAIGADPIQRIAHEMEELIDATCDHPTPPTIEVAETLFRGLEIMGVLASDARRQRRGFPAAALTGAVDALLEQVARVAPARSEVTTMAPTLELARRAGRDACDRLGKAVEILVTGGDIEAPRALAHAVADPLAHLVRNSIDHGIEDVAIRLATGKPASGRVELLATVDGRHLVVEVRDDGAGLDLDVIRVRAAPATALPASIGKCLRLMTVPFKVSTVQSELR